MDTFLSETLKNFFRIALPPRSTELFDVKLRSVRSISLVLSLLLPTVAFAQAPAECTLEPTSVFAGTLLEASWRGMSFDGRGGIDTFRSGDTITVSPRAEKLTSVEVLDTRNDIFPTIIVDAEMILTTEPEEIEVVADWFFFAAYPARPAATK